jgi:hypothetical protein
MGRMVGVRVLLTACVLTPLLLPTGSQLHRLPPLVVYQRAVRPHWLDQGLRAVVYCRPHPGALL